MSKRDIYQLFRKVEAARDQHVAEEAAGSDQVAKAKREPQEMTPEFIQAQLLKFNERALSDGNYKTALNNAIQTVSGNSKGLAISYSTQRVGDGFQGTVSILNYGDGTTGFAGSIAATEKAAENEAAKQAFAEIESFDAELFTDAPMGDGSARSAAKNKRPKRAFPTGGGDWTWPTPGNFGNTGGMADMWAPRKTLKLMNTW